MTDSDRVTLYYNHHSRAVGTRVLLEELGAPYDVRFLDLEADDQLKPDFLAVNPMGKVPTIVHRGAVVTEQVAVTIYLADAFQGAGLAPAIGDPLRGPYLRWIAFEGSCFEPAIMDRYLKREPAPRSMSPFADPDTTIRTILDRIAEGPYLLGERFSAADVLWGVSLDWITRFGLLERTPALGAYLDRVTNRPAFLRVAKTTAEIEAARAGHGRAG
ncbi:glutathione S-transferase family protein [Oharaeibacter diazotrophicus]|uniref:Glutathione S-transferase n=1 Tax=Oharaeibacter diazotrophicus TaxID=1920512 RepID=A0A4R6R714_9HYPH|nr:glutathione S-transferase family protein [Oharaeibacter diazotrophicus]TDP81495.1 glutathione S-transferase [Oharaeibacter diazotrophicus]BBE73733.1 disulfide-bond oxidoreductase YfcG [Pleomorphomonas sp. SM30]GLS75523.1 glutathione S-transferase [Oharaeibacter diazotrophicus]